MNKILIIGQALPAVRQIHPYDTTMLYDWLKEVGISKEKAQHIFQFEAVCPKFPGYNSNGGHLKPNKKEMYEHWVNHLQVQVEGADKIWALGNVPKEFIEKMPKTWSCNTDWIYTIHPSKRNWNIYQRDKEQLLNTIKTIIS